MCEKCRELVECPIGEERQVLIDKREELVTDYYGRKHRDCGLIMRIYKYESEYTDCDIGRHFVDDNNIYIGFTINIRHCPYCGEKLY